MRRLLKTKTGFTFLEVLAALVILSFALLPIMSWVPTSIQTKLKNERLTTSIFLAQDLLEELRYEVQANFSAPRNVSTPQAFFAPHQDFFYTVSDDLNTNLKTIGVSVWHTEQPQKATNVTTQFARR